MVATIGFFDGVHLGHRLVIKRLVEEAQGRGLPSIVLTFHPHPRVVLQNGADSFRLLSSPDDRRQMLLSLGVDRVETLPFTRDFASLTAEQFIREYLIERFGVKVVLLGYDNRFGSDCLDSDEVAEIMRRLGIDVVRTDGVRHMGEGTISSTLIRQSLEAGDVGRAAAMLGYPYSLHGVVVAGNRIGRTIGFPTANMQLYEPLKLVPKSGVYEVDVRLGERHFKGICNIGTRPTVGAGNAMTIETHILEFDEDIYGMDLSISFVSRIRDEHHFPSLEDLRLQLEQDKAIIAAGLR